MLQLLQACCHHRYALLPTPRGLLLVSAFVLSQLKGMQSDVILVRHAHASQAVAVFQLVCSALFPVMLSEVQMHVTCCLSSKGPRDCI